MVAAFLLICGRGERENTPFPQSLASLSADATPFSSRRGFNYAYMTQPPFSLLYLFLVFN